MLANGTLEIQIIFPYVSIILFLHILKKNVYIVEKFIKFNNFSKIVHQYNNSGNSSPW